MTTWRSLLLLSAACLAVCFVVGCDDNDGPARSYDENLGTGDMILMPPPSPALNAKVAEGKAEMPEFREPGDVEGTIRDLVDEFNELVEDKAFDDLPDFYIERQRENVTAMLTFAQEALDKLDEIQAVVEEKDAELGKEFSEALATLMQQNDDKIVLDTVAPVSDALVNAIRKAPAKPNPAIPFNPEIKFHLMDDEWYIEDPNIDVIAPMLPMLKTMTMQQLDQLLSSVQAEGAPLEQVLESMKAMAAMSGGNAPGEGGAAPVEEDTEEAVEGEGTEEDENGGSGEDELPEKPVGTPG